MENVNVKRESKYKMAFTSLISNKEIFFVKIKIILRQVTLRERIFAVKKFALSKKKHSKKHFTILTLIGMTVTNLDESKGMDKQ